MPVKYLVLVEINNRTFNQESFQSFHFALHKNGVFLLQNHVADVDRTGAFFTKLLLQLEKPLSDLLLNVGWQLSFSAHKLRLNVCTEASPHFQLLPVGITHCTERVLKLLLRFLKLSFSAPDARRQHRQVLVTLRLTHYFQPILVRQ